MSKSPAIYNFACVLLFDIRKLHLIVFFKSTNVLLRFKMKLWQILILFILALNFTNSAELDSVSDDDLVHLFKKETYLVVLFCTWVD